MRALPASLLHRAYRRGKRALARASAKVGDDDDEQDEREDAAADGEAVDCARGAAMRGDEGARAGGDGWGWGWVGGVCVCVGGGGSA